MTEVMSKTGDVDNIGVAAQGFAEFSSDLSDFEGVSQPGAREIGLTSDHDLGLGSQAAKSRGMQNPGTISCKITAHGLLDRLVHEPGGVMLGIALGHITRLVRDTNSEAQRPE